MPRASTGERLRSSLLGWAMAAAPDPAEADKMGDQLAQIYCLRSLLERVAGLVVTAVALEAGRVILVLPEPLPEAWWPYVQQLGGPAVEVRLGGTWPLCQSLDGDHCNGDYDRS